MSIEGISLTNSIEKIGMDQPGLVVESENSLPPTPNKTHSTTGECGRVYPVLEDSPKSMFW